jgi:hypothetical protein
MSEPPRQVREFTIIEPSGRRFNVRYLTPAQKVRAALGIAALLIVSLALWAIQLSPVWVPIVAWFR